MNTYDLRRVAGVVEGLAEEIYPTSIFPELTAQNKQDMARVEAMFPNLIARIDSSACRRSFKIATKRITEIDEDQEPF